MRVEDLAVVEQEIASREELRDKVFTKLEQEGILSYGPQREVIVDLAQLKNKRSGTGWRRFTNSFLGNNRYQTYLKNGGGKTKVDCFV